MRTQINDAVQEIYAARGAVDEAQRNYSRGLVGCETVNKANRRLADAFDRRDEVLGGRARDVR